MPSRRRRRGDFHPHGAVAASYGVQRPAEGFSERAIFVIDQQGKVAWSKVYAIPEPPANSDVLAVLERLGESSANRDAVK
jgi:alkyl hydroperoxide reductase subunit AhpC